MIITANVDMYKYLKSKIGFENTVDIHTIKFLPNGIYFFLRDGSSTFLTYKELELN